jgi:benzoyl-CoA reductase/2-hydroxyglutaryl-CoA dehydratase subunit BcrC/BadD/HgdB
MTDPVEKAKDVVESLEHPIETAKELEKEVEEGSSPRTPWIAITGVGLFAGVIVAIVLAIALTVYFVYGGK